MPQLTDSMYTCDELKQLIADYEKKVAELDAKIGPAKATREAADKANHDAHEKWKPVHAAYMKAMYAHTEALKHTPDFTPVDPAVEAAYKAAEKAEQAANAVAKVAWAKSHEAIKALNDLEEAR